MIICHSHKFIFIHIHKTGGTSLENALDPHLAWNDLILGGSPFGERIQQFYTKKFGLNKHSTIADIERICGRDLVEDYYVFALVRHPLARMCSMYNWVATTLNGWAQQQNIELRDVARHITPEAAKRKPALGWTSTKVFLRSKNFSEFIRQREMSRAPGFRAQTSCLTGSEGGPPKAEPLRIEDLAAWLGPLKQRLGIEFDLRRDNESRLKLVDENAVSADDRAHIETIFRSDYETFGYNG
jgi:hypothetical protein